MSECTIIVKPYIKLTATCIIQAFYHCHLALLNLKINPIRIRLDKSVNANWVNFKDSANNLHELEEHPVFIEHSDISLSCLIDVVPPPSKIIWLQGQTSTMLAISLGSLPFVVEQDYSSSTAMALTPA